LKHSGQEKTVVIPVFDFYDDLETANPLGSHAVIHKVGVKYTVVKGFSPIVNSKLENIFLNMVINSSERTTHGVFDIYLDEMSKLETEGFSVTLDDGESYKVFVVMVQVIGDNLGLNGLLGYVEGFTANYPCRLCKMARLDFNTTFSEQELLRGPDSYDDDVLICNPTMTGVKDCCPYNVLPSFHATDNVHCDIMHDIAEGVCRYVIASVLNCLIYDRKYFALHTLNGRKSAFSFDYSSPPPLLTADNIKKGTLYLTAIEMLNLVLALNLMVGDLVPDGDPAWEVYLMLRLIVLYCCGLAFSVDELQYFQTIVEQFLQEYRSVFASPVTLKFHNMVHDPRVIRMFGPLYHSWVIRCEAKHADLKKVAHSAGNFKNICRTLAVRHQMQQAERFLSHRGFDEVGCLYLPASKIQTIFLCDLVDGRKISQLLGHYGLFRELFTSKCVCVSSIYYHTDDVLVYMQDQDNVFPDFVKISEIYIMDDHQCVFVCTLLHASILHYHFQAYEVVDSAEMVVLHAKSLQDLPSPWPLKMRVVNEISYVSLRHKI